MVFQNSPFKRDDTSFALTKIVMAANSQSVLFD